MLHEWEAAEGIAAASLSVRSTSLTGVRIEQAAEVTDVADVDWQIDLAEAEVAGVRGVGIYCDQRVRGVGLISAHHQRTVSRAVGIDGGKRLIERAALEQANIACVQNVAEIASAEQIAEIAAHQASARIGRVHIGVDQRIARATADIGIGIDRAADVSVQQLAGQPVAAKQAIDGVADIAAGHAAGASKQAVDGVANVRPANSIGQAVAVDIGMNEARIAVTDDIGREQRAVLCPAVGLQFGLQILRRQMSAFVAKADQLDMRRYVRF